MRTFEELGVCEEIRRAIEEMGFVQPMPVQEEVIPTLLESRRDTIALAQTGTGKTAAFGIPLLQRHVEAVYGGAAIEPQMRALRKGIQIIVATPGRLIDLKNRGYAQLDEVCNIVLDEADEMLNMGFSDSINEIFESLPEEHNTLMFSATMSREVERVAKDYLKDHQEIVVGSRNEGAENVNHIYYMVQAKDKYLALKRIVDYNPRIFAIIFCRTKLETQEIADKLIKDGYNAEALHGDLSQQQRDLTMQKFRQHLTQLLVATDVAARGLDVDDLTHVINFGLPDDIENYTHRSGRTGRAGKKGTSISIVHSKEKHKVRNIEKEIGKKFEEAEIPKAEDICKKQLYKVMDQIVKTDVDDEEIAPFMDDINRYFEYIDKEEIIKKIVSLEFGKFLAYYADAPEIEKVEAKKKTERGDRRDDKGKRREDRGQNDRQKRMNKPEPGFHRLFINLGKRDGFYPGELMKTLNRYVGGRQEVGHIDLLDTISYFEVPEKDARKVMTQLSGIRFHGRIVRCNSEDDDNKPEKREARQPRESRRGERGEKGERSERGERNERGERRDGEQRRRGGKHDDFVPQKGKNDWRDLMRIATEDNKRGRGKRELIGEEPDFSEEGWARRKPKKKK